jgi:hypothetical protein
LCLLFGLTAFGQVGINATLSGTVSDSSVALISGVEVTAKNVDTGVTSTSVTNETGTYRFPSLQPGNYEVSAAMAGFQAQTSWVRPSRSEIRHTPIIARTGDVFAPGAIEMYSPWKRLSSTMSADQFWRPLSCEQLGKLGPRLVPWDERIGFHRQRRPDLSAKADSCYDPKKIAVRQRASTGSL